MKHWGIELRSSNGVAEHEYDAQFAAVRKVVEKSPDSAAPPAKDRIVIHEVGLPGPE